MFTVFCDETGNSGSRFFSPEQPVYGEGGWFVREDRRAELEAAVQELEHVYGFTPQSKGTRLKDSPAGRRYLTAVLDRVSRDATPFLYLVEKRYFICAKAVWTYFDPHYNPTVDMEEIRDPRIRKRRADLLYAAPDGILLSFADAFRAQDCGKIVAVGGQWADALAAGGHRGMAAQLRLGLTLLRENIAGEFTSYARMGLPRGWDTLNAPSFAQAAQVIEQSGIPCRLLHDECATLEASFQHFFRFYGDAERRLITRADGTMEIFGFRSLRGLSFGDSESLPLLRAADYLLAGCAGFVRLAVAGAPAAENLRDLASHGLSRMMHVAIGVEPPQCAVGQVGEVMASDAWIKKLAEQFWARSR